MVDFHLNIPVILAQTSLFGIPTARLVTWLMLVLIIILLVMLAVRLFRWLGRMLASKNSAAEAPTRPQQPPISVESALVKSQYRAEAAAAEKATAAAAVASSSEAAKGLSGQARSWESRSLFGQTGSSRTAQPLPPVEPGDIPFNGTSDYQFGQLTPALSALLPESDARKQSLKHELIEAGYYTPHAYENLAAVRYLGLMLPLLFFGALLVFGPPQLEPVMLGLMVAGAVLGWSLPRLLVRSKAAKRRNEIEQALPDVIDLLNMCVSQGMTLRSALARVSWEITDTYPAMAEELRIVAEQANIGTLEHALSNMNKRVDVPELHSLNSLLIQTERMGTNVSDSLTEYSDGMRATLQQRADQKANAATFKLLFPTVLCLMPAVYFFLLGPAVVELSEFFSAGGLDRYRQVEVRGNNQEQP